MRQWFNLTLVSLAILVISACSTTTSDNSLGSSFNDFLTRIREITLADANAALADVHAHGDVDLASLTCLPGIIEFINSSPVTPGTPDIKGVLSANQIKRNVMIGGLDKNGPFQLALRKLHVACAAYVGDEARFAAQFAAMVGAASHGVPPVTGLPSAIGGIIKP